MFLSSISYLIACEHFGLFWFTYSLNIPTFSLQCATKILANLDKYLVYKGEKQNIFSEEDGTRKF